MTDRTPRRLDDAQLASLRVSVLDLCERADELLAEQVELVAALERNRAAQEEIR